MWPDRPRSIRACGRGRWWAAISRESGPRPSDDILGAAMSHVALTFDDGPGPATSALLDVLAARGTRASFFLLGVNVERAREVVIRLMREGHTVGNHSHTHPRPDATDEARFAEEVRRNDALLREVAAEAGVTLPE